MSANEERDFTKKEVASEYSKWKKTETFEGRSKSFLKRLVRSIDKLPSKLRDLFKKMEISAELEIDYLEGKRETETIRRGIPKKVEELVDNITEEQPKLKPIKPVIVKIAELAVTPPRATMAKIQNFFTGGRVSKHAVFQEWIKKNAKKVLTKQERIYLSGRLFQPGKYKEVINKLNDEFAKDTGLQQTQKKYAPISYKSWFRKNYKKLLSKDEIRALANRLFATKEAQKARKKMKRLYKLKFGLEA